MAQYPFETWDVFTDQRFAGNPLAIVFDAQGLSDQEMQTITGEFNLSETVFILPPEDPANTARIRIFTLGYEMPFAGHPTVGAAHALKRARKLSDALRLELNTGVFSISLDERDGKPIATFTNPNLPTKTGDAPLTDGLEAALGLTAGALDRDAFRPGRFGAGVDFVYARAALADVQSAQLHHAAFDSLGLDSVVGVLLYADGGETPDGTFHARMFAPNAGIAEDPATGSAAAALPAHVLCGGGVADGTHSWIVEQGFEMGRPSIIQLTVEVSAGAVTGVQVGGGAVPIMEGVLTV